ncbi:MAG: cytochrome C [Kiritimatiellaeota bacterium]|nr:cytochrome C [Kiritimatiellota bacterium]
MTKPRRFSRLFYNRITYMGVIIFLIFTVVEICLFILDFLEKGKNLYLGLVMYALLPGVIFFGILLIPAGVFWKKRRIRREFPDVELGRFRIDLSLPHHRNALLVFIIAFSVLIFISLVGSYKAFQYSESVKFCGALCHEVMNPEYTAYRQSPHGKVKCVDCHIGPGAEWYVRSKLSGMRQVFRTLTRTYDRPIQTPVKNLRPAEATCKQCHWPGKYFSTMDFSRSYFSGDDSWPPWHIRLLLRVGSGKDQSYGVHAHMNIQNAITYAAEDKKRQNITWVKSVAEDGKETIYVSPDSIWKDKTPPADRLRTMDCIDCHNRPTHQFLAPYRLINKAMQLGDIDPSIPMIKEKAMEAMSKEYKTAKEATASIKKDLEEYYRTKQATYYAANPEKVEKAIQTVVGLFSTNMFPDMKVRWDTHPDNIGHMVSKGCFRCHDGEHKSRDGKVITHSCNACHLIVEQGPEGQLEKNIDGLDFKHPDGDDAWKEMSCTDCHTGGA